MGTSTLGPVDRLRQPEYTGENRCIPCTTVNVVIAVVLAVGIAIVQPIVAGVVFVLSLAAIYLRGYLVPGTPTLTQRYFPEWVLAKFDKAPTDSAVAGATVEADSDAEVEPPESVVPEEWLLEHDVLVECADVDDLCLTDELHGPFHERFERFRDGDQVAAIAAFLDVEPEKLTVEDEGLRNVRYDGRFVARWRSEGPLVADLAAASVLEERVPAWKALTAKQRSEIAGGLRAFADACPLCEGPIAFDERVERSCCGREKLVYSVGCDACNETLLEYKQNARVED